MQRLATIAPPQVHEIWALLSQIPDPEIPVLTITDLGMVRNVTQMGEGWVIGFTPTYSGCPATEHLIGAIREAMTTNGFTPVANWHCCAMWWLPERTRVLGCRKSLSASCLAQAERNV